MLDEYPFNLVYFASENWNSKLDAILTKLHFGFHLKIPLSYNFPVITSTLRYGRGLHMYSNQDGNHDDDNQLE